MTTKHYSDAYLGTIPASDEHIRDIIRSALKGTGFSLRQCGRNPNRRQFYDLYPDRTRGEYNPDTRTWKRTQRGGLQQDLPLKHATSVALYLKTTKSGWYSLEKVIKAKKKIGKALSGQPLAVTSKGVAYLNVVRDVYRLHKIVTHIGIASKILASA